MRYGYIPSLLYIAVVTDMSLKQRKKGENRMYRKKLNKRASRKVFRKNTGVQKLNKVNPRNMRGGIRL